MLQVHKLKKAFAGRVLFDQTTWHVSERDRVGLTGPNGSGKTTLFRILAGAEPADEGRVVCPRGTRVGYLPQDGLFHRGRTLRQEAMSAFAELLQLREEQRQLEETMSGLHPESPDYRSVLTRYGECQDAWERLDGFSMDAQMEEVLFGLGFKPAELSLATESFSGGWQMRIALAKLLLARPTVLLLDEPTNHLDLQARDWMEDYLETYPFAVVLVSHDRFFLDRIVNRITEIERRQLTDYPGNYSHYLMTREKQIAELRAKATAQEKEIARIERFIERFRYKATKAPQVQSRVKMLEKMERIELPPERKIMKLRLPECGRPGRVVIELRGLKKAYGDNVVFRGVDMLVERGDRVALIGPNGAGKSTLMRLLAQVEAADGGEMQVGHRVSFGYFSQERYDLNEDKSVLDNLVETAPMEMVGQLRSLLGAFLFHGDDVDKKVKVLSGGEKSRLALARMLLRSANVLLLDEPTNHLDLDSKEVLLDALRAFQGTLLFVSHDRYFIDELATKTAEIGDGDVQVHWGNYEDLLRLKKPSEPSTDPTPAVLPKAASKTTPASGRRTSKNHLRQLRRELSELEELIAEKETAVSSLEGRMSVPGFYDDREAAQQILATHQELKQDLERMYRSWEMLEAEKESVKTGATH